MAVSFDTYDEEHGIHPHNKQIPSKRLACSALNVAYGMKDYPANGPFPEAIDFSQLDDFIQVDVLLDQDFRWNDTESNGFSYCCSSDLVECNSIEGQWTRVDSVNLNGRAISMTIPSCSVGFAYLWETTPVLGMEGLPMYATDICNLPAAPWIVPVEFNMK